MNKYMIAFAYIGVISILVAIWSPIWNIKFLLNGIFFILWSAIINNAIDEQKEEK